MYEWQRVADAVTADIAEGRIAVGAMLPGERALAEQYGVALGTARRAVRALRDRGLVTTLPAKGTFVVATPD